MTFTFQILEENRIPTPNPHFKSMSQKINKFRQTLEEETQRTPDSKLRKKILLRNTLKHNTDEKEECPEKSPVCNLFSNDPGRIDTELQAIDGCSSENDQNEISMKSVVLSSDEYSSSSSDSEMETMGRRKWKTYMKPTSPIRSKVGA